MLVRLVIIFFRSWIGLRCLRSRVFLFNIIPLYSICFLSFTFHQALDLGSLGLIILVIKCLFLWYQICNIYTILLIIILIYLFILWLGSDQFSGSLMHYHEKMYKSTTGPVIMLRCVCWLPGRYHSGVLFSFRHFLLVYSDKEL